MNLQSFFAVTGGSYDEVLSRLLKEDRVLKYLGKFAESDEYSQLLQALKNEDWELAFRMAHSMKGMCANLGLENLRLSSSDLCEMLRPGKKPEEDYSRQLAQVTKDYEATIFAIKELLN